MSADRNLLDGLEAAVAVAPDNVSLRLHFVALLLDAGEPGQAMDHCRAVLDADPAHVGALELAARAAQELGDTARAEGYRRLANALGGETSAPVSPPPSEPLRPMPQPAQAADPEEYVKGDHEDSGKVLPMRVIRGEKVEVSNPDNLELPKITLEDVGGMDEVKRRLNIAFLAPLRNPEIMKLFGKSLRGGLLLYGPPGCGKTFIARATAGELGAKFLSVGLAEVLDMWIGNSEKNLREMFETARRNSPCVLFFDEIDALGRKRSLTRHSAMAGVVNQFLAEMDGMTNNNDGVFVLAASNHPWDVDVALRRPGRLDRTLLVLPPDRPARLDILRANVRDRPLEKVDVEWLADKTGDFSGADIVHLCESAAELAIEDSLATGRTRPIVMDDFKRALKEVRPSVRPWFETAKNYAQFANEGGVYDDLLSYLRARRWL
jgi:ATP-dependent 26S proteasome regulatory subunit